MARGLAYAPPGAPARLQPCTFDLGPGLTLVRGGDGRGKTTALRLLAGELAPTHGSLTRPAGPVAQGHGPEPDDPTPGVDWLARHAARYPAWDPERQRMLAHAFGLTPHLGKSGLMLSTGTRRKVGLLVAFSAGAPVTLLDTPFAGLDAPSRACLAALLAEAAGDPVRAWVLADTEYPAALGSVTLAATVDLGD
ncbi:MAG: ABC transporter ATP-binding protein [Burkholderiaceae bacterium]